MQPKRELDADEFAQEIANVWGAATHAGNSKELSPDFKQLFDKACNYRIAKKVADNSRENDKLTAQEAAEEQATKKALLDAGVVFYKTRETGVS
jgi:hypothetical protein